MIVVLDSNENIIEFLDDDLADLEITDTYGGYQSLELDYQLTDINKDKYIFKQGNKIFTENCLFVMNNECNFDYVDNLISIEAEEYVSELNYCEPFYVHDHTYANFIKGTTVTISKQFLTRLLTGFYNVKDTDLDEIKDNLKIVTVLGTITKYNLLKEIESVTGLVFKREYFIQNNKIIKEISLLKPENYGKTHNKVVESVVFGENTNKLAYATDETKNALGIMPIVSSENSSEVDYDKILDQFYHLDINNRNIDPYYATYEFSSDDLLEPAKRLIATVDFQKYLPESVTISHEEIFTEPTDVEYNGSNTSKIYDVTVGMGQLLALFSESIVNEVEGNINNIPLSLVYNAEYPISTPIDGIFTVEDIQSIADKVNNHCVLNGQAPNFISTNNGTLSFQLLVYLLAKYLVTGKSVILDTEDLHIISNILPTFVQEELSYIVGYSNFEYMPYLYTQNSSESNNLPLKEATGVTGKKSYDITNYISESYPILTVKKTPGASQIAVRVTSQGIADDTPTTFGVYFKTPGIIQDDSEIEIDFSNRTIKYMKYVETTETKEVQETVETGNDNVITITGMPSCSHCSGTPYKKYTKTWINKCPHCGREGSLRANPKGVYEGEVTCGDGKAPYTEGCDADYCAYCGYEKIRGSSYHLTPGEEKTTTTQTKTVTEVKGEYKETTASESDDSTSNDNKELLSDVITAQSVLGVFYGDCSIQLEGCSLVSLTCDSTKLYELAPFPYIKQRGDQYIYAPVTKAEFNYTHVSNSSPKLEPFETSEQSVEEVLIGCWQKLNGSGDDTKWLEKSESIEVDLVNANDYNYNTGDFVYIKLPDSLVFKAQVTEINYNPKLLGDKSIKIGNIRRESII